MTLAGLVQLPLPSHNGLPVRVNDYGETGLAPTIAEFAEFPEFDGILVPHKCLPRLRCLRALVDMKVALLEASL